MVRSARRFFYNLRFRRFFFTPSRAFNLDKFVTDYIWNRCQIKNKVPGPPAALPQKNDIETKFTRKKRTRKLGNVLGKKKNGVTHAHQFKMKIHK